MERHWSTSGKPRPHAARSLVAAPHSRFLIYGAIFLLYNIARKIGGIVGAAFVSSGRKVEPNGRARGPWGEMGGIYWENLELNRFMQ